MSSAAEGAAIKVLMETLTKLLIEEIQFLRGVKDELELLQSELEWMVPSFIAANKVVKSDTTLETWVKQLRGIIYQAEDVVDEFNIKIVNHKRLQMRSRPPMAILAWSKSLFTSTKQLPFVHSIGVRIEKINASASKLKQNKDNYGSVMAKVINGSPASMSLHQKIESRRTVIYEEEYRQDDYVNIHEGIVGQVMPLLTGIEGAGQDKPLRVISLVGMGGVGKTTLSKKLYDLSNGFDCSARVYISKSYTLVDLLKSIMNQCFGPTTDEQFSKEKLRAKLQGKKYLILLDDVWDMDVWDNFKGSFPPNKGSIVLLTTRHKEIARYASSSSITNIHELNVLNETESWQLFLNRVNPEPALEDLGKEMVKMCHGLPLAIEVLGGLLLSQPRERNAWAAVNLRARWLSSKDTDYSHKCPGILALSYDYMPYNLKQCFLYTSIFPEDSNISVTKLFQYWIAEGFVSKTHNQTMEDAAEASLEDLIRRNLIQVSRSGYDGKVKRYRMHDLIRDISLVESNNDQFSQIYGSIDKIYQEKPNTFRVAVYCKTGALNNKQGFHKSFHTKIRFLMCRNAHLEEYNFSSLFGGFKSLRVLEFFGYIKGGGRISFPKEIGELIHLRYLSFEKTKLEPINTSYLSKLVNLQTLNLDGCIDELMLDDKIWSFHELRHLYLKGVRPTPYNRSPGNSTVDKLRIDKLENLHLLHIQAGDWIDGGGLEKLTELRKLRIEECLHSHTEKISKAVAGLTQLQSLALISKTISTPIPQPISSIQFLNHTSLTRLHLSGKINGWSEHNSFPPNLCKLKLEWSSILEDPMPILERLPSLTFLLLGRNCSLGRNMVCSGGGFVCLETLKIVSLENLEVWTIENGALTSLRNLEIRGCRMLNEILDGLQRLTTLEDLKVADMPPQFRNKVETGGHKISHINSVEVLA
ncbi:hypothetical protein MKW94_022842 [Papaver nudicaule]|uniref:Uncharacterized protein n=1 Tax=Papaver nudicaule TaxID=74823 RepID=A0AA41VCU1_PAPNU|nr:hypothetical protein [Papaver nudicaule]